MESGTAVCSCSQSGSEARRGRGSKAACGDFGHDVFYDACVGTVRKTLLSELLCQERLKDLMN